MKKTLIILICLIPLIISCGSKEEAAKPEEKKDVVLGERFAALANGVYKSSDLSGKPFIYLSKGEQVILLDEIQTTDKKNKEITVLKIKLSDGNEGFVNDRYFGIKRIVITSGKVPVYKRNSDVSTPSKILKKGTVAVVTMQKGDWYQVISWQTPEDDQKVWNNWIKDGFSEETDLVIEALQMEKAKNLLKNGNKDKADLILEILSESDYDYIREEAGSLLNSDEQSEEELEDTTDTSGGVDPDSDNKEVSEEDSEGM